jgi:histidyl-tRNA synthetase
VEVFVVDLTDGSSARDLTHELRSAGISADRRFGGGSMRSQMKSADRSGAHWAVLIGSDELDSGTVTVRDLRSDAPQSAVPRTDLVAELRRRGTTT